jgi:hypothetical protein
MNKLKHCKHCDLKKHHLISSTGKVYWKCDQYGIIVHNLDNCEEAKRKAEKCKKG